MAKLSGEQRTAAELAVLIYETVLENLKNGGRPVMARALEPDENYFSDDPEKMSSPMIKKFLGSFEADGRKLDLWLCSEINWYAPGKIYVGLKADSIDEAPLDSARPDVAPSPKGSNRRRRCTLYGTLRIRLRCHSEGFRG